MNYLTTNLTLLKTKDPALAGQIEQCVPKPHYIVRETSTAFPTLLIQSGPQQVALHHPRQPMEHAGEVVSRNPDLNKARTLLLMDCGLGYVPLTLIKQGIPRDRIFLYQPTLDVLRLALEHVDWTPLLSHSNCTIVIGHEHGSAYRSIAQRIPEYIANPPALLDSPNVTQAFPEWSRSVKQQLQDALRMGQSGLATKWQVAPMSIKNVLTNLSSVIHSHPIAGYKSLLKGKPAVVVAAGPSLQKNIHTLRNARSDVFIIATDTALGPLRKAGIEPHWVCSVDPTPLNERHFPEESYPGPLRLLYDPETLPAIVRKFSRRAVCMIDKHEFFTWMDKELKGVGIVRKGSMVSESALLAATWLGCDPVILIGQDLALDPDTLASHHNDAALCRTMSLPDDDKNTIVVPHLDGKGSNRDPLYWVDGVHGRPVPTIQSFYVYIRQLEQCIHQLSLHVIDATEGGALLKGTTVMPLEEALEAHGSNETDLRDELEALEQNLPPAIDQTPEHLRSQMNTILNSRMNFAEKAISSLSSIHNFSIPQVESICNKVRIEIFNDPVAEFLIESAAPQELFAFMNRGPANATPEEQKQVLVRQVRALLDATRAAQSRLKPFLNE